jgi:tetratricopeptide (TPR) repeat protein
VEVKFNIARAHYDDGEYDQAGALFTAFALNNPGFKDATVAGHLALDSLRQLNDFKGMDEAGNKFLASAMPAPFKEEVKKILTAARSEALGELAIKSAEATGDVVEGLLQVAEQNKGSEIGEKALYAAFTAARDKHDLQRERELGAKFITSYAKSQYLPDVLLTLGRQAAEAARFEEAAQWYEQVGERLGADSAALDGWIAAARLRQALNQTREAIKDLESAAPVGGARKSEVLATLAEVALKGHDNVRARSAAEQALKVDKQNAAAAAVMAELMANGGEKPEPLVAILGPVTKGPNAQSEDTAKALWYLGEIVFRSFKAIPSDQLDQKVATLQQMEGVYTQAASMGSAEWAVASLWKMGLAYQHIAETLENTPMPPGLSPKDAEQYRKVVATQVGPLKDRADGAYKLCLSRSVSLEVFSEAVVGCRNHTDAPRSPLPSGPPGAAGAASVDDLLKKVESTMDAASLEALGLAYLESGKTYQAQLALGRATELQDTRASAHNALGLALLYSGDAMGARSAYGRALDADPTYAKARANLAALRCRYGDAEGAKRELSVLKDVSGLTGGDVDPEWRSCK